MTQLTDIDRRVIGNLSIPRNVADLAFELRRDPYAPSLAEDDVHQLLELLQNDGSVVNLGDGHAQSTGELAAQANSNAATYSMPDEKAQIFEARLALPHRRWRLEGDVWMWTQDGFDRLHEPTSEPVTLSETALAAMIEGEWSRTVSGGEEAGAGQLTEEEFTTWLDAVQQDYLARNNLDTLPPSLRGPMAGGSPGYADATENLLIDAENGRGSGYVVTSPWYLALTTAAVTDADTGSTMTEATYTGYARKSVASTDMAVASAGSSANGNAIIFAACTGLTSTVIGFAKCIAATVGVLQKYGTVPSTVVDVTHTPPQFAVGQLTTSID